MRSSAVVLEGLDFGEGPRWHDGRLWYSDFYRHTVRALGPDGVVEDIVTVVGQPSGLGWLPDGRLLVVSMLDRRVLRLEADGSLATHADLSDIAEFHCNDMVVSATGNAYVGNFGFDLENAAPLATATLALIDPDGTVTAAAHELSFPNGTVVADDGTMLVVAETLGSKLTAFTIGDDGRLTDRRVWAEVPGRFPDGCTLDDDGAIWFADAIAPRAVRVAEGGEVLDEVETTQNCFACALGGPEGRDLYLLTAPTSMPAEVRGLGLARIEVARVDAGHAGRP